jgi:tetraacyldisaccharide 4'-kinase
MWLLTFASLPYSIAVFVVLRLRSMRPVRVDVPVISVGNMVVGGTGKTPIVIYVARRLVKAGHSVAVVSRGYGRSGGGVVLVSRGERPIVAWREAGDEAYLTALLTRGAAVVVAKRRADGIRYAVDRLGAGAIILDDAFQHLQVARDLDVVAVDALHPIGNGMMFPAGTLREHPLGITRAGLIIATRCDSAGGADRVRGTLGALARAVPVVETRMRPAEFWDVATGKALEPGAFMASPLLAVSGIGDPGGFFSMLEGLGFALADRVAFPDHHAYDTQDLAELEERLEAVGARAVLTTEKDAVRLGGWRPAVPVIAVGIDLEVLRGQEFLDDALATVMRF